MVVAALLLDLQIGEVLRRSGLVGQVSAGWRIWTMPCDPSIPAFGTRSVYDPESGWGAGVCWHDRLSRSCSLPNPENISALTDTAIGKTLTSEALLRLRYNGWLQGTKCTIPVLNRDSPIWQALEETALEAVHWAYAPVLEESMFIGTAAGEKRLLLSRMIMETALDQLIRREVVPPPEDDTEYRWLSEREWTLATETI